MLIAREKKKSNIAEYLLYMWQLEDMLRAMGLDVNMVKSKIIDNFHVDADTAKAMYDWYDNLIAMMRLEKIEEKGHLQVVKNVMAELTELHYYLLQQAVDPRYRQLVTMAAGNLVDFRAKSGVDNGVSDVELALNALYGHLMLKLQKKEILPQTQNAMETFSKMLAYLAVKYKELEENENKA